MKKLTPEMKTALDAFPDDTLHDKLFDKIQKMAPELEEDEVTALLDEYYADLREQADEAFAEDCAGRQERSHEVPDFEFSFDDEDDHGYSSEYMNR